MMKRWMLRAAAAGVAGVLAATAFAPAASAHVTVSSPDAVGGGYGKLVFRVPNEEPKADTVALTLHLPEDMPFASVSTMQKPGWTVSAEETKLGKPVENDGLKLTKAVTTVTWKAKPGQASRPARSTSSSCRWDHCRRAAASSSRPPHRSTPMARR